MSHELIETELFRSAYFDGAIHWWAHRNPSYCAGDIVGRHGLDLARRSARSQLRPQPPHATKDHVRIRVTLGKRIPTWSTDEVAGGAACAPDSRHVPARM